MPYFCRPNLTYNCFYPICPMLPHATNEELYYQIALTQVNGIGAKIGRTLIDHYGTAINLFKVPLKELMLLEGVGPTKIKGFKDPEIFHTADRELSYIAKHNIQTYFYKQEYPSRLNTCVDAPLLLYFKGNVPLEAPKMVSVVGTRKCTEYGKQLCEELIVCLKQVENLVVVSGLALGIDAIAHRKSLQMGIPTIGVLGHGIDRIYPYEHKEMSIQMQQNGGLLTEFCSGTLPDKANFPMRNRIVAALSDVTIVVESSKAGGALITAHMAHGYNREVAAYPGRTNDYRSAGCNDLIRTHVAAMITKPEQLLELMNWDKSAKRQPVQRQLMLTFTEDEAKIMNALQQKETTHADELQHITGIAGSALASVLLTLEMQGLLKTLPGKNYKLI